MIFLFEDFPYSKKFLVDAIGFDPLNNGQNACCFNTEQINENVAIKGVGYCFFNNHPVFVLPKVFVYKENEYSVRSAFGISIDSEGKDFFGAQTEQLENEHQENKSIEKSRRRFLSSLSMWLYSAIDKYKKEGGKEAGVKTISQNENQDFKENARYATLLDVVSSMELFYKKNQNLFVFIAKNKNNGNHKINWTRTVNRKTPFIQDGVPIYMDTVNKVKAFDLDDRLLVLYFSAMMYIQEKFGYTMPQSEFYQPLKMNEMERLLENEHGLQELKKIKYKYF